MIVASLLAIASLTFATPATAQSAAYAPDTVRAMKGHPSIPARADAGTRNGANAVCHPDPSKGRACRHHVSKKEEARSQAAAHNALAVSDEQHAH